MTIVNRSDAAEGEQIYDEYGNEIRGEIRTTTVGEIQQRRQAEESDAVGIGDFILFLPPETPLDTNDAVIVNGRTYEVMGPPWYARNPRTGEEHHVEVALRRTAGEEES